jgi:hypothetical protein
VAEAAVEAVADRAAAAVEAVAALTAAVEALTTPDAKRTGPQGPLRNFGAGLSFCPDFFYFVLGARPHNSCLRKVFNTANHPVGRFLIRHTENARCGGALKAGHTGSTFGFCI